MDRVTCQKVHWQQGMKWMEGCAIGSSFSLFMNGLVLNCTDPMVNI